MTSTKLIPALSMAGLSLTGCSDPIIGDWELTKVNEDTFPVTGSYSVDGITCTYEIAGGLGLAENDDKTIGGELFLSYSLNCDGFDPISERPSWSIAADVTEKGASYTLSDTDGDLEDFGCTLAEDLLTCDQSGDKFEFTRVEE